MPTTIDPLADTELRPVEGIRKLAPYKQGKSRLDGVADPIKLSANESMAGPSPKAITAYRDVAIDRLHLYPDGSQAGLRTAIGSVFELDPEKIVCGNGSDELIQLVMRAYLAPGDEAVISQYSFGMAFVHATSIGAIAVTAPEPALKPDVDMILARITPKTRMVVLASPNNPVGQYMTRDELVRLRRALPDSVLLLIDSAYSDYVLEHDYEPGSQLVDAYPNTVMTRTFSKLYGLSSLRIGWMYAPPGVVDSVQRIRTPFNTNAAALAAAEAAVRDQDYAAAIRDENNRERERLRAQLTAAGIEFIPSYANFYLLRFASDGKTAQGAAEYLEKNGVIPRPVAAGGPENCLRITVGLREHNDRVIELLTQFMES